MLKKSNGRICGVLKEAIYGFCYFLSTKVKYSAVEMVKKCGRIETRIGKSWTSHQLEENKNHDK